MNMKLVFQPLTNPNNNFDNLQLRTPKKHESLKFQLRPTKRMTTVSPFRKFG